jgi:hypothetical protein
MIYHSIMIPTRGRPALLERAVHALLTTMSEPDTVEILICMDNDDQATAGGLLSPVFKDPRVKLYLLDNSHLRAKYNHMEGKATGAMLYYWSDDVFMQTRAWDMTMRLFYDRHIHKKFICSFKDDIWNGNMGLNVPAGPFCLSRGWVKAIGHTINPKLKWQAIDLWLWDVGRRADVIDHAHDDLGTCTNRFRNYLPDIHAHHAHRERPKDDTDAAAVPDFHPAVKEIYDTKAGENERQEEANRLKKG